MFQCFIYIHSSYRKFGNPLHGSKNISEILNITDYISASKLSRIYQCLKLELVARLPELFDKAPKKKIKYQKWEKERQIKSTGAKLVQSSMYYPETDQYEISI